MINKTEVENKKHTKLKLLLGGTIVTEGIILTSKIKPFLKMTTTVNLFFLSNPISIPYWAILLVLSLPVPLIISALKDNDSEKALNKLLKKFNELERS